MMTPPARRVTGGVDTHGDVHVAAVVDSATGRHLGTESFSASAAGYSELLEWLARFGQLGQVGVESTGSYGAALLRFLQAEGIEVIEVDQPDRKARRFEGKSDPIDAEAAARAVLSGRASSIPKSRDGLVEAVRALEVVHHGSVKDRTRAINQFKALLVSAPEELRSGLRRMTFADQLGRARRWPDGHGDPVEREVRWALKELARRIGFLDEQTARLETRIGELAAQASPALMGTVRSRSSCRRPAPRRCRGQPGPHALGGGLRQALRRLSDPGLIGQDHPPPIRPAICPPERSSASFAPRPV